MSRTRATAADLRVRPLREGDLDGLPWVDFGDAARGGSGEWPAVLRRFLDDDRGPLRVGLAAEQDERVVGYLLGEVRAFEFGSEPCGWVFAVGVAPDRAGQGAGSALLGEACRRFRAAGVRCVRTMVRRNDVPILSFFRSNGFVGGSFVQLELGLGESG